MASVNRVTIVGNLGRDPEMRTMPSGDQLANVTIATTDKWKDKQTGEMKEATEWHRVTFNGRLAEVVGQYLRKGSQVYVEGSLRTRKWTDQAGVEKYSTEIRADQMQMLGARQDGGGRDQGGYDDGVGQQQARQQPQQQRQAPQQGNQRQQPQGGQQGQQGGQRGGYAQPQQPQQRQQPQQDQRGGGGGGFQGDSGFDSMESDIPFIDCSMIHDMESKLDRRIRKSRV